MIHKEERLIDSPFHSKAFDLYFSGLTGAVLDIETTGLRPWSDAAILVGIVLTEADDTGTVTQKAIQIFAETLAEEEELLRETARILNDVDYVVTYNGKRFDMPFLKTRAKKNHLTFPDPYDLDLYQVIRNYSSLKNMLPSLSQKSIEHYMGLSDDRSDRIDGGESVDQYFRWLDTGDKETLNKILLHNRDDIVLLGKLLAVLENCDLHRAMFRSGFPDKQFKIDDVKASRKELHLELSSLNPIEDCIIFPTADKPYHLIGSSSDNHIQITFPSEQLTDENAVLDCLSILGCEDLNTFEEKFSFSNYPGVESGYLIYAHNKCINYLGINGFLQAFLKNLQLPRQ